MNSLKSFYNYLDLPYDATEQDVIIKQKTLIRMHRINAIKKGVSSNKTIQKINERASVIISFIRENGPLANEENHKESIKNEIYALILAVLATFAIAFILL